MGQRLPKLNSEGNQLFQFGANPQPVVMMQMMATTVPLVRQAAPEPRHVGVQPHYPQYIRPQQQPQNVQRWQPQIAQPQQPQFMQQWQPQIAQPQQPQFMQQWQPQIVHQRQQQFIQPWQQQQIVQPQFIQRH
jgi:hypothetical protein